jgi:hypothetical protein
MRLLILSLFFLLLACDESVTEFHKGRINITGPIWRCQNGLDPYGVHYGGMVNDSVFSLYLLASHWGVNPY